MTDLTARYDGASGEVKFTWKDRTFNFEEINQYMSGISDTEQQALTQSMLRQFGKHQEDARRSEIIEDSFAKLLV